jgi:hypothetical protein
MLYNIAKGGFGGNGGSNRGKHYGLKHIVSKETVKKIQKTKKEKAKKRGYWHSKKTIEKIIKNHVGLECHKSDCSCYFCKSKRGEYKGVNNPFYKKTHTEKTRYKMHIAKLRNPIWCKGLTKETDERVARQAKHNTENWRNQYGQVQNGRKQTSMAHGSRD